MDTNEARIELARALSELHSRDSALRGTATTLDVSLLEAILALDSDQSDALQTLGAGNRLEYSDDGRVRLGRLQRLQRMRERLFGTSDSKGLLQLLRDMPDTNQSDEDI